MAKKLYRLHISNEKLFLLEFSRGIPQSLRQENTSKNSFHYIFHTFEPDSTSKQHQNMFIIELHIMVLSFELEKFKSFKDS